MLGRSDSAIPLSRVKQYPCFAMNYYIKRSSRRHARDEEATWLWSARSFGKRVIRAGLGGGRLLYSFNGAGLEIMKHAKSIGMSCTMEQTIAPKLVEIALLDRAESQYPEWASGRLQSGSRQAFAEREMQEWNLANTIICPSQFVANGIRDVGGPSEKCIVVPYGIDTSVVGRIRQVGTRPMRVLYVGAIGLRKGAQDFVQVALKLRSQCEFRMVGPGRMPDSIRKTVPFIQIAGAVPRSEVGMHYDWADVLYLPSLCEGSATVTYEALVRGLPVICTPNTGSPVVDGRDGWIVPIGKPDVASHVLEDLLSRPVILEVASEQALKHKSRLGMTAYSSRLIGALGLD